jgi:nicotinate-nucleotide adenylyltransferase
MKLGFLGGTFDPIHLGHLLMAETAREALGLPRILFVPAGDPPHKRDRRHTPARHRRGMVELALADNANFELCSVDLDRPGPHYSTDTVRLIREQYDLSAETCLFIIGSDSLVDLPDWHRPQELITLCRLVVIHRPGSQPDLTRLEKEIPGIRSRLEWVEMPPIGLAGTEIREKVRTGRTIRYQVLDVVRKYIQAHGLYLMSSEKTVW